VQGKEYWIFNYLFAPRKIHSSSIVWVSKPKKNKERSP